MITNSGWIKRGLLALAAVMARPPRRDPRSRRLLALPGAGVSPFGVRRFIGAVVRLASAAAGAGNETYQSADESAHSKPTPAGAAKASNRRDSV